MLRLRIRTKTVANSLLSQDIRCTTNPSTGNSRGSAGLPFQPPHCRRLYAFLSSATGTAMAWRRIGANSLYMLVATAALAALQWLIMAMIARREGTVALGL